MMVCGLAVSCATLSATYPADISGHVTIAQTVKAKYPDKPDTMEMTPLEGQIYWIVDISVKNKSYENAVTASSSHWEIIVDDKVYDAQRPFMGIQSAYPVTVPVGETGETTIRFSVPDTLKVSSAKLCYQGQEPYSYGKLTGGDKVAAYDWDLRAAVGGAGKGIATTLAIISVALIITAVIAIKLHSKRCEKCGKWNALEEIKAAEEIERREVTRRKILKEYHRNKSGELIETVEKEVYVPGVEVTYRITKKCKFCGYVSYGYKIKDNDDM